MLDSHHRHHKFLTLTQTIEFLGGVLPARQHVFFELVSLFLCRQELDNVLDLFCSKRIAITKKRAKEGEGYQGKHEGRKERKLIERTSGPQHLPFRHGSFSVSPK